MKLIIKIIIAALLVLLASSYLLSKKEKKQYSDDELRQTALSRDMSSVPSTYKELLKVVDSPQNRLTQEKIDLGKRLFFDKVLSKDRDISCDSCHMIDRDIKNKKTFSSMLLSKNATPNDCVVCHLSDQSGTDRLETAIGHRQQENPFHLNTLSILNSALAKHQTWSGEIDTVEEQAGASIQDPYKMNLNAEEAQQRLSLDTSYVLMFEKAFHDSQNPHMPTLTFENTQKAIGAYVRTLLTRSDYDKFLDGDNNAISQEAKKGLANFINFGCKGCHTGKAVGGQSIQKFPLRDYNSFLDLTNTFNENVKGRSVSQVSFNFNMYHPFPFENVGGFMGKNGQQLFRVPLLRNVTKTSPYFHNGSIAKLRDAVQLMAKHQLGMNLTDTQTDEIVEFLKTLEGSIVEYSIQDTREAYEN
ncbi:c-type cytochrome [bacterium]|nr:c-type cytochrome [bacterium]MBU1993694.1 c-type cytochrome [bacterium]